MDTVSPGLDAPAFNVKGLAWEWPRLSKRFWAAVALACFLALLFGFRLLVCLTSVLACTR